eukprot:1150769-Rhodomonas_salina.1
MFPRTGTICLAGTMGSVGGWWVVASARVQSVRDSGSKLLATSSSHAPFPNHGLLCGSAPPRHYALHPWVLPWHVAINSNHQVSGFTVQPPKSSSQYRHKQLQAYAVYTPTVWEGPRRTYAPDRACPSTNPRTVHFVDEPEEASELQPGIVDSEPLIPRSRAGMCC